MPTAQATGAMPHENNSDTLHMGDDFRFVAILVVLSVATSLQNDLNDAAANGGGSSDPRPYGSQAESDIEYVNSLLFLLRHKVPLIHTLITRNQLSTRKVIQLA